MSLLGNRRKLLGLCSISHTALEYRQGPRFMRGLERCSTCGTDESRSTDEEKKMRKLMMLAALLAMVALADILQYGSTADEFEFEEVGSTITVSPTSSTTCDEQVNQAATAAG